jgi:hypothetical protein
MLSRKPCRGDAWFQQQVDAGQRKVSFDRSLDAEERTISGAVLWKAIRETQEIPLVVENAIVRGAVSFSYYTIAQPLQFQDCVFTERFLALRMRLAALQFAGCDFR